MVNKLANVAGGEIFAIPLFLSDRSELERFKKSNFFLNIRYKGNLYN